MANGVSRYAPGIGNTNSYLNTGFPFLKSDITATNGFASATALFDDSANQILFPAIAKIVYVRNSTAGGSIRITFASLNIPDQTTPTDSAVKVAKTWLELGPGESYTFETKCYAVYIHGASGDVTGVTLAASLTNIARTGQLKNLEFSADSFAADPTVNTIRGITAA